MTLPPNQKHPRATANKGEFQITGGCPDTILPNLPAFESKMPNKIKILEIINKPPPYNPSLLSFTLLKYG
jgi:hypothetical protein